MRIKRILSGGSATVALRVLFTLALAAPITCRNEAEPYFSLSSNRTFASSDQPEVMLSGWQVPAVWSCVPSMFGSLEVKVFYPT
jgi:hypothetical protein